MNKDKDVTISANVINVYFFMYFIINVLKCVLKRRYLCRFDVYAIIEIYHIDWRFLLCGNLKGKLEFSL